MNKYILPAICAVAGMAAGAVGGFFFAKARYKSVYEKQANEEMKEFIKHYEEKNPPIVSKGEDDHNDISDNWKKEAVQDFPKEAWEKAVRNAEPVRNKYYKVAKDNYDKSKDEEKPKASEAKPEYEKNPDVEYSMESDEGPDNWDRREFDDPYLITADEHYQEQNDWESIELQWDPDSMVLSDLDGNIYPYPAETIGMENLRYAEDHADSEIYVRNERDDCDYLITIKDV